MPTKIRWIPQDVPLHEEDDLFGVFQVDDWDELREVVEVHVEPHSLLRQGESEFDGDVPLAVVNRDGIGQSVELSFPFTLRDFWKEVRCTAEIATELVHFMRLIERAEAGGGVLAVTVSELCLGCRFDGDRPRTRLSAAQRERVADTLGQYRLEAARLPSSLSGWTLIYVAKSRIAREMQRHGVAKWPAAAPRQSRRPEAST